MMENGLIGFATRCDTEYIQTQSDVISEPTTMEEASFETPLIEDNRTESSNGVESETIATHVDSAPNNNQVGCNGDDSFIIDSVAPNSAPAECQISESMTYYNQTGEVIVGQGGIKEALLLGLGLPKLSRQQEDNLARARRYALEQSIKHVLLKQTVAHQQQQQKNAMYSQALSLMSRVYVGSVSFELKEETIRGAFSPFGPIKSINMSFDPTTGHHKGFAFVEFELPEAASLAQDQMNGLLMGGRNIKVGRPSNMPQAQPIVDTIMSDAKMCNRVYVSSIHLDLSENDVKSVFEAFGRVTSIEMPKNPFSTKHRGYAYLEYETEKGALDAVASMNLFDLGGQYLRVGRAVTPPQAMQYMTPASGSALPTAAAVAAAAVTAKIQALEATSPSPSTTSIAPTVVVAPATVVNPLMSGVPAPGIISIPPPGVAIPQPLSSMTTSSAAGNTIPAPSIVLPQLFSTPVTTINGFAAPIVTPHVTSFNAVPPPPPPPSTFVAAAPAAGIGVTPPPLPPTIVSSTSRPSGRGFGPPVPAVVPPIGIVQPVPPPTLAATSGVVVPPPAPPPTTMTTSAATGTAESAGPSLLQQQMQSAQIAQKLLQNPALSEQQKKLIEMEAGQTLASQEDLKIKGNEARNILMHKLMRRIESCVLVLRNMVESQDIDDTLEEEVHSECSNFGKVEDLTIYQEKQYDADDAPVIVKIFIKYSLPQEAEAAKNNFDGRFFDGRRIKAEIYDTHLYESNDLSH